MLEKPVFGQIEFNGFFGEKILTSISVGRIAVFL